jgi:Domain of unknown function (DUF2341).
MYYRNPDAVSKSNGKDVFEFFEDWENTRDPNWVDGSGVAGLWEYASPGYHGNYRLHFKTGRSSGRLYNMWWKGKTFDNFRFIAFVRADYADDDVNIVFRSTGGEASTNYYNPIGYRVSLPRTGDQRFLLIRIAPDGSYSLLKGLSAPPSSEWVRFEVIAIGSSITVNIERPPGNYLGTLSVTDSTFLSGYIGLAAPGWDANRNPSFDAFAVAKIVSPEPSYTFGTEQSFRIKITNKRLNEYVSLVNVTYEVFSTRDSNVILEFYLNNNLIDTKHIISQKHK